MRVITGSARGRRLKAPTGLATRPTAEMVKEAVFSMIQFEVEGAAALDLFAGSGQMGIEALSRGARSCVFVDSSKQCRDIIGENVAAAGFGERSRILCADAFAYVSGPAGPFDIVFLDPPYCAGLWDKLLEPVSRAVTSAGVIICETNAAENLPPAAGILQKFREYRYGKTKITVYRGETET